MKDGDLEVQWCSRPPRMVRSCAARVGDDRQSREGVWCHQRAQYLHTWVWSDQYPAPWWCPSPFLRVGGDTCTRVQGEEGCWKTIRIENKATMGVNSRVWRKILRSSIRKKMNLTSECHYTGHLCPGTSKGWKDIQMLFTCAKSRKASTDQSKIKGREVKKNKVSNVETEESNTKYHMVSK